MSDIRAENAGAPTTSSVVAVLADLRPLLDADTSDPDPLTAVLQVLAGVTPGLAGLTLCRRRSGRPTLHTAASTHQALTSLDAAQLRAGRGPIFDAVSDHTTIDTIDITDDPRWPTVAQRLAGSPAMSAVSVPVRDTNRLTTVLTLYSRAPLDPAHHSQIPLLTALLETALVSLAQHERVRNLRHATASNRRIGIALGVVMAHDRSTPDQAFDTLAATSQALNRKLADLAEDIILTGALPESPAPAQVVP